MRITREFNQIPSNSQELFLPTELLRDGYLAKSGIIHGGISYLHKDTKIGRTSNRPFHIFIMTLEGEGRFIMEDNTEFTCPPGMMFFSAANGMGHIHMPISSIWKIGWLQIDKEAKWMTTFPYDYKLKTCLNFDEIKRCIEEIIKESIAMDSNFNMIQDLYSQLLVQYIKREMKIADSKSSTFIYQRKFSELWQEVSMNIGESWDIEALCGFMNISKAHLTRLCRQFYGLSPAEKVRQIKMDHAFALLFNLDFTVSQVSEVIGYSNISAFSAAFKNYFGILPKDANPYRSPQRHYLEKNGSI